MLAIFRTVVITALTMMHFAVNAQETIKIAPSDNVQEVLLEALILAEEGTTIELAEGFYELSDGLSLDVANVKIIGAGHDKTILSFKNQQSGSEGFLITSDNVWLEGFAVEDTPGDAIKSKGVDTITFKNLRVEWTNGPDENNGAYGLYPIDNRNVLIDGVIAKGASDAGIYVGQSQNIIVRNSHAEHNVAGIEIENSYYADVYDNIAIHNTGGILVFDMPNLPQKGGHSVRVFNNHVVDNNTDNFAPEGNIVGTVPRGTGILVMANTHVEVFNNTIVNHDSVSILISAFPKDYNDPTYNPIPKGIYLHDNIMDRSGHNPDNAIKRLVEPATGLPIPDIVWDGAVDGVWAAFFGPDDADGIFINEKPGTTFVNMNAVLDMILPWGASPDLDITDHAEVYFPTLKPVKLPQESQ